MQVVYYKAPFSNLEIIGDSHGLKEINFVNFYAKTDIKDKNIELFLYELDEYFKGNLQNFTTKINISGTEFEKKVYNALLKIPYSKTKSYKQIAELIGHKNAFRAVGNANAKNKLPIIIPCHRVVASNGMGGYSGGIAIKKFLLNLEKNSSLIL